MKQNQNTQGKKNPTKPEVLNQTPLVEYQKTRSYSVKALDYWFSTDAEAIPSSLVEGIQLKK